jgi:hypothetical protein
MEVQRKILHSIEEVADGKPPKSLLEQIKAFEAELGRLDGEMADRESRARLGQLNVAQALQDLEPVLTAWRDILRGNLVRARQVLRKLVTEPIMMEPLPEVHGYRWKGTLNGGADLEGAQKYLGCRGPGPTMEQWVRSATGRR